MRNKCSHLRATELSSSILGQGVRWMWCVDCGAIRKDETLTFNVFLSSSDFEVGEWITPNIIDELTNPEKEADPSNILAKEKDNE